MATTTNSTDGTSQRKPDVLPPHRQPRANQTNSNGTGNATIQANQNSTTGNMYNTAVQVVISSPVQQSTRGATQTKGGSAGRKPLGKSTSGSSNGQAGKQAGGGRGSLNEEEKQLRKHLRLCAYCGGKNHAVDECRKLAAAEKYKSGTRGAVKPTPKPKVNTGAPPAAPKDPADRAAVAKKWADVAKAFGDHDDWVKSPEAYEARKEKMMERAAREKEQAEVRKQEHKVTFKETTGETVGGKLGGVRKVKKVEKS